MPVITFITDFGTQDEYAGIMKGVILSINPDAAIIDITHRIDAYDLIHAAYTVFSSYKYFPKGTVHVVVVDPGVGGDRAVVALEIDGHVFLAPDNGVLTLLLNERHVNTLVRVENPGFFLKPVSRTFHGRDIFAPVSAHISLGIALEKLGPLVDQTGLKKLSLPRPVISGSGELIGTIVSIDRFGNLITDIDTDIFEKFCISTSDKTPEIKIGKKKITGLSDNYESVSYQEPLMIIGSRGYLEIAVNRGSAKSCFKAEKGDSVCVGIS